MAQPQSVDRQLLDQRTQGARVSMGYVYLIGPTDWRLDRVKIGTTRNSPWERLSALQTGCPFPLQVYAYFDGGCNLERVLHETFAPLRVIGEWFHLDGKLLDFVSNVYSEAFGKKPIDQKTLWAIFNDCVIAEEAGYPLTEAEREVWMASADDGVLSSWMHDIAWAEYCRGRAN